MPLYSMDIECTKNIGQHPATLYGLFQAKGKYILTMDDDGEHDAKEALSLVQKLEKGDEEVVYGKYKATQHAAWRWISSYFLGCYLKYMKIIPPCCSSFRALKYSVLAKISAQKIPFIFIEPLLLRSGAKIGHLSTSQQLRIEKGTNYTMERLLTLAWNILSSYTSRVNQGIIALGSAGWVVLFGEVFQLSAWIFLQGLMLMFFSSKKKYTCMKQWLQSMHHHCEKL